MSSADELRHRFTILRRARTFGPLAAAATAAVLALAACSDSGADTDAETTAADGESDAQDGAEVRDDLEEVFDEAGIVGTFAAYDPVTEEAVLVNPDMAAERAAPASSFKIPNSLIALEEGAVADVDEVIPWDGEPQSIPEWEQDLSMREAYPLSAVPHYQELARRVGAEAYEEWVAELDYGNAEIGEVVDRFWLDGPLEISAEEQVHFLDDFYHGDVPGDPENLAQVHEIMVQEDYADDYDQVIRAKSGWADTFEPGIGWYVGWVEDGSDVTTFALRVEIEEDEDVGQRIPMALEMLERLEVLTS